MNPDDIPAAVTALVYTDPSGVAFTQSQLAAFLTHYWPAIQAHVRKQAETAVADEMAGLGRRLDAVRAVVGRWDECSVGPQPRILLDDIRFAVDSGEARRGPARPA
jgi:hypothetical protein